MTTVAADLPRLEPLERQIAGVGQWPAPVASDDRPVTAPVAGVELDYTAFFLHEYAPVVRTVSLMLGDEARAEEIAQDAFVQVHLRWTTVSAYERPGAWVRRVAIRLAMRVIRRDRLWSIVRGRLLPPDPPAGSRHDLAGAISRLPSSQRAAIVLHYYEDRPVGEIAAILGCAEPTARVHLHRARKRLAVLLGEDDDVA